MENMLVTLNLQFFAETKAANLVDPEVMAPAISAKLPNAVKFAKWADVDRTLVGEAGSTITRPKYVYIGAAEDLVEGVAMDTTQMSMSTTEVTVKEAGKAVEITEKAILTNVSGTVGEAEKQLRMSIADKMEIDFIAELETAPQTIAGSPTTVANILAGLALFNAEGNLSVVLYINPTDYTTLVGNIIAAGGQAGALALSSGQVSELLGLAGIERSRRVEVGKGYLQVVRDPQQQDSEDVGSAMEIVLKKDVDVNRDADILKRTVVIAANAYYGVNLKDEAGVVKFAGA